MGSSKALAALAAALCLLGSASLALAAEETTRDAYAAAAEPICKASTQANEKILAGVRQEVKGGKLKAASAQFAKASTALKKTLAKLEAVPQPAADEARLAKWLGYVSDEAGLFESVSKKLAAGDKNGAQAMVLRLTHTANLANNQVLSFDFTYCRFEPSKFT